MKSKSLYNLCEIEQEENRGRSFMQGVVVGLQVSEVPGGTWKVSHVDRSHTDGNDGRLFLLDSPRAEHQVRVTKIPTWLKQERKA